MPWLIPPPPPPPRGYRASEELDFRPFFDAIQLKPVDQETWGAIKTVAGWFDEDPMHLGYELNYDVRRMRL